MKPPSTTIVSLLLASLGMAAALNAQDANAGAGLEIDINNSAGFEAKIAERDPG